MHTKKVIEALGGNLPALEESSKEPIPKPTSKIPHSKYSQPKTWHGSSAPRRSFKSLSWGAFFCLLIPIFGWCVALIKLVSGDARAALNVFFYTTLSFSIGVGIMFLGFSVPLIALFGGVIPMIYIFQISNRVSSGEIYWG